jgi:hypothetical protein
MADTQDHFRTVPDVSVEALTEAIAAGPGGPLDHYPARSRAWGFDPTSMACADITCPRGIGTRTCSVWTTRKRPHLPPSGRDARPCPLSGRDA